MNVYVQTGQSRACALQPLGDVCLSILLDVMLTATYKTYGWLGLQGAMWDSNKTNMPNPSAVSGKIEKGD